MRQYAWYSSELDVLILQTIIDGCEISFEWGYVDACETIDIYGPDESILSKVSWIPLGEL
jgi:hypothetical protein